MSLSTEKQILDALKGSQHALITFRKDWSVDAVASALALKHAAECWGKRADIVTDGFTATKPVAFLPRVREIRPSFSQMHKFVINLDLARAKIDELHYDVDGDKLRIFVTPKDGRFEHQDVTTEATDFKYDLVITLDTPDYNSLGRTFTDHTEFFYQCPTINIDNDPANEQYGNINAVDITATSAAEIVFRLLNEAGRHLLCEDAATCLLAGIISKTRSFKTPTVTPHTLKAASDLIAAGARREEIVNNLYRTRSLATLKLWGRALARLKFDPEAKFAWSLLVRQDFVHAGAKEETLPDVIEELIVNSPEAEIIGLIYEQAAPDRPGETAGICALIASDKHADAPGLVAGLQPEGTRRLARVCFPRADLLDAEQSVRESIYRSLGKGRPSQKLSGQSELPHPAAEPLERKAAAGK